MRQDSFNGYILVVDTDHYAGNFGPRHQIGTRANDHY